MGKLGALFLLVVGCQGPTIDINSQMHPDLAMPDLTQQPMSGGLVIPKSGPPYTGSHTDPNLNDAAQCPDSILEPNDGPGTALSFTPMPDMPTPKIIKLAICPTGPNPAVGQHDQDWIKVDNSFGPASLTMVAQIFYDISLGDLDVAIVDSSGNLLSSDGTAVTNGCAAAAISNGVYYVVVTGANNSDVNTYEALIRTYSTARGCP